MPKLAPFLPLSIPTPLAKGQPGEGYPWRWSIYRWLEGEPVAIAAVYAFQQKLHRLLMFKHRKARQCKRLIKVFLNYIQQLKESSFSFLNILGKTL